MSFTPSEHFNERWLQSPDVIKQTILGELDDIKKLLDDATRVADFRFKSPDFHDKLTHLQTAHLQTLKDQLVKAKKEQIHALTPYLESCIDEQLNDKIKLVQEDVKVWLRQFIKQTLDELEQKT